MSGNPYGLTCSTRSCDYMRKLSGQEIVVLTLQGFFSNGSVASNWQLLLPVAEYSTLWIYHKTNPIQEFRMFFIILQIPPNMCHVSAHVYNYSCRINPQKNSFPFTQSSFDWDMLVVLLIYILSVSHFRLIIQSIQFPLQLLHTIQWGYKSQFHSVPAFKKFIP